MHLNHLNLCVEDLAEARSFFADLFDFHTIDQRGNALVVMTDGHGFTLVLSDAKAFGDDPPHYPKVFHVGFIVKTDEEVDMAHDRLTSAGVAVRAPSSLHGSYACYFTALGGILFEVSCRNLRASD